MYLGLSEVELYKGYQILRYNSGNMEYTTNVDIIIDGEVDFAVGDTVSTLQELKDIIDEATS